MQDANQLWSSLERIKRKEEEESLYLIYAKASELEGLLIYFFVSSCEEGEVYQYLFWGRLLIGCEGGTPARMKPQNYPSSL